MNRENVEKYAKKAGFTQVAFIDTKDITFEPSYRAFCEGNACGNYGNNYGCPPDCGTPEEMKQQALAYDHALVFRLESTLIDAYDSEATKAMKLDHTYMTLKVMADLRDEGISGRAIMAGPCNFCQECKIKTGEPCAFPEVRFSCLSAYCIDATKLAKACDMEISWSGDQVTLFSLFLYND